MKFEVNAQGVDQMHRQLDAAGRGGLDDVNAEVQSTAPRRTGEFASSFRTVWQDSTTGGSGGLASDLPQAHAVEAGADVGPRRGPHMAGSHTLANAGRKWPEHVTRRLQGGA